MKIMHISPDMYTGGAQKFCIDICNELAKDENNEVILCSIEKLTKEQHIMHEKIDPKVKFISLNKKGKSPLIMLKIAQLICSIKPDITHTHTRAQIYSSLGLLLHRRPNVHTIHSVAHKELGKQRLKVHKYLYDYFNFTPVSISDQVLETTKALYGDKYDIKIDNGTQRLNSKLECDETNNFINTLKKDKHTKIFVSVGRLYEVKNQELLIEAFEAFLDEGFDAHLLILGSLDVMPEYTQLCKNKIKRDNNIHLMGERKNVSDFLLQADALCFSSIYEGLPMSIIEAMSIGIPTVSTPVGGIPDVVIDGEIGYLSKDMSVEGYKEALKRVILKETVNKDTLISHYDKYYSIEDCVKQYADLYKKRVELV